MQMINPSQRNLINQFNNMSREQQAERIAKLANEKGITKEQLKSFYEAIKK